MANEVQSTGGPEASGGGGGGGTWGSITGTLSNQTDLQSALNAKQNTITTLPVTNGGTGANNSTNTSGSFLRSNGANGNYVASTLILPNAATVNRVLFASSTNTISDSTSVLINNGPLSDIITSNFLSVTGTLNSTNTASDPVGVRLNITAPAMGSPSTTPEVQAFQVQFNDTGVQTGNVLSIGASIANDKSGGATALVTAFPATGTALTGLGGDNGGFFQANAAGSASLADKIGSISRAGNGPQNFGALNIAAVNDANINIGTVGVSAGSGTPIGGHFQIGTTLPTWHSAAVSADIGSSTGYVFYGSKTHGTAVVFTVSNTLGMTFNTTGLNGGNVVFSGDNKNTEIQINNTSGSGKNWGISSSSATATLVTSLYITNNTNAHTNLLINNSGDFMVGSALSDTTGGGATAYFPVSGTIALNNPVTITGNKLSLVAGSIASGANAFALTTTMPVSMSGATAAINWTITGAGSSSQNNRAVLINYAAGYTGSSKNIAFEVDNNNNGTGTGLNLTAAGTNPNGNSGVNSSVFNSTTGSGQAGYYDASGGNINIGAVGKAVGTKNSATNVGLIGAAINAGSSSKQIGVLAYIASADDPTYTSAALVADNGSSASPMAIFAINGTPSWTLDSGGQLIGSTSGKGITLKTGSNCKIGTGTLIGGTVTITNTSVTSASIIFLQDTTSGALTNVGTMSVVAGSGSFIVTSTNILDTSTFNYIIFETN